MDLLQHAKESYTHELERRNELRRALGLPVSIAVVFAGAQFSLFRAFPWGLTESAIEIGFGVTWSAAVLSWIALVVFLIWGHVGHPYAYIATPKELRDYRNKLAEHDDTSISDENINAELEQFLEAEYADNAHHNSIKNDKKSVFLHRANQALVVSLLFTVLSGSIVLVADLCE